MNVLLNVLKWSAAVGAVTLAVLALKPLLDRRFSPRWRYWLWLVLAAALLLAPVRWEALIPALPEPAVTVEAPEVYLPVERPIPVPAEGDKTFSDAAPSGPVTRPGDGPERTVELSAVLAALWLTGAGAFALWHAMGTALLLRRVRRWSVPVKAEVREAYGALCRELGVRHPPELTVSRNLGSPMAMGLLRPRLCLPDRAFEGRELEFILRHELTHVRRRDLWYKALMLAANALHWFNPLIWLLRREANETVELLCDERTMTGADRETRREYCETLLLNIRRERGAALTTHFYGGVRSVKGRFKNLLSGKGRRFGWAALAAGVLIVAVTACAVGVGGKGDWKADLTLYDPDARLGEGFTVEATGLSSGSPEVSAKGGFGFLTEFTVTAEGLSFTAPVFTPREGEGWIGLLWNAVLKDPITGEDRSEDAYFFGAYLKIWLDGVEREAELFEIVEAGDGYAYHVRFREPLTEEEAESGTLFVVCGSDEWLEAHGLASEPVRAVVWSVDLTDDRVYDAIFPGFGADVTWTDGQPSVAHLGDCSQVSDFTLNYSCVSFALYDNAAQEVRWAVLPIREFAVYDYLRDNTEDDWRENTPENRAELEKRFVVELDGVTVPGELVVTGGNDCTYFVYVFDEPLLEPVGSTVHIYVCREGWNEGMSPELQSKADGIGDTAPDPQPKEDLSGETENREEKKELIFYWGGPPIEDRTPATLYMGDGYSVYIPDEGWESSEGTYGGCAVQVWQNATVESAQLQVVELGEMDLEEAREFVRNNEPDFTLIEDKRGDIGGNDVQGEITLEASFYWTDTSMYAVIWRMDTGESEQIFVMLKVMAESFRLTGYPAY